MVGPLSATCNASVKQMKGEGGESGSQRCSTMRQNKHALQGVEYFESSCSCSAGIQTQACLEAAKTPDSLLPTQSRSPIRPLFRERDMSVEANEDISSQGLSEVQKYGRCCSFFVMCNSFVVEQNEDVYELEREQSCVWIDSSYYYTYSSVVCVYVCSVAMHRDIV